MTTRYRIYRLPHGDGFYVVFEDKKAYCFPEQVPFDEAIKACLTVIEDESSNSWNGFIRDFNTFGIEGFGWYSSSSIVV